MPMDRANGLALPFGKPLDVCQPHPPQTASPGEHACSRTASDFEANLDARRRSGHASHEGVRIGPVFGHNISAPTAVFTPDRPMR
jgi:hypothetical protein